MRAQGYATDVAYPMTFVHSLAPAWLDHVAIVSGIGPPARRDGFAYCELGCGQGVTTTILAATHPQGRFVGVDLMSSHIRHAQRLAAEGAVRNIRFFAADIATAAAMQQPGFDYIVAHGIYSWIGVGGQAAVRTFVDRHLKPGGLVYISYNAVPGRVDDLSYQRLTRALSNSFPGNSLARFNAAIAIVDRIAELKPPALATSPLLCRVRKGGTGLPLAYLVHELLNDNWEPLCVTEVRAAMAMVGLAPVGSATLVQNFDSLVLRRAARKALSTIADDDVRELARDYLINQSFRCDVFVRGSRRLSEAGRRRRLRAATFAVARPRHRVRYAMLTPAGRLRFDNAAARAIVSVLAAGPASLEHIIGEAGVQPQDVVTNILALCAAGAVWPVEPGRAVVSMLNEVIRRRLGGPEEIRYLVLPCGTAVAIDDALLVLLKGQEPARVHGRGHWQRFLASHGVQISG